MFASLRRKSERGFLFTPSGPEVTSLHKPPMGCGCTVEDPFPLSADAPPAVPFLVHASYRTRPRAQENLHLYWSGYSLVSTRQRCSLQRLKVASGLVTTCENIRTNITNIGKCTMSLHL